jgi:transcriptional antiterminator RfaH
MLDAAPACQLDRPVTDTFPVRNAAPCGCTGPRWTAVATWPQAEHLAQNNLERQRFATYLPRIAILRRRTHRVSVPMFAGYLFVQHQPDTSWRPLYETPGVRSVLRNGSRLQYAPEAAISALRGAEALAVARCQDEPQWAPGTPCSLRTGPLTGHPAVVLATHRDTASLAVLLFGALRQVSAPIAWLAARD